MANSEARAYSLGAFLLQLLLGACAGAGLTGFISAKLITWWATPGYAQNQLNCGPSIDAALKDLLRYMLYGAASFALIVPLFAYLLFYRRRKLEPPPPPPVQAGA